MTVPYSIDDVVAHYSHPHERYEIASAVLHEIRRRLRPSAEEYHPCPSCRQSLPRSAFAADASRPRRVDWRCRACRSAATRKRR